eukprot:CAMPEP_0184483048 /NCGR_PEP_ID=MMETSP0113_2-20130426/4657_1 /TAXON_ID=91329 /ORGANISM="Norrisiella sphaerica, Strain BC52" /LENGTH=147 /DNA_ID=CAMNT_0026863179 /DNA_START=92 /DNA_END=535 /DNA_ORIENTATION=+
MVLVLLFQNNTPAGDLGAGVTNFRGRMALNAPRVISGPGCMTRLAPMRAIKEPTSTSTGTEVGQSWAQLLDTVSKKESYQLPPEQKMELVRQIYVARDDIKEAYDRTREGTSRRRDMTMSLKRLKRFLKYGLLDCPDADVIPDDLKA